MPPSLTMALCHVRSVSPENRLSNSYSPSNNPLNPKRKRKSQTEKRMDKQMEKQTEKQTEKKPPPPPPPLKIRRPMERDGQDRPARLRRAVDLSRRVQVPGRGRRQPVGRREWLDDISCHNSPKTLPHVLQTAALQRVGGTAAAPLPPRARSDRGRAIGSVQRLVFFFVFFYIIIMLCHYAM